MDSYLMMHTWPMGMPWHSPAQTRRESNPSREKQLKGRFTSAKPQLHSSTSPTAPPQYSSRSPIPSPQIGFREPAPKVPNLSCFRTLVWSERVFDGEDGGFVSRFVLEWGKVRGWRIGGQVLRSVQGLSNFFFSFVFLLVEFSGFVGFVDLGGSCSLIWRWMRTLASRQWRFSQKAGVFCRRSRPPLVVER